MHRKPECSNCECGAHTWALTTRGRVALVDRVDAHLLEQVAWQARNVERLSPYVYSRKAKRMFDSKSGYLHTIVLRLPIDQKVDHINGAGVDCRRDNLRPAPQMKNTWNRRGCRSSTSAFKGVSWQTGKKCWVAQIRVAGVNRHLGYFNDERAAARAYDAAALPAHREFARPNLQAASVS